MVKDPLMNALEVPSSGNDGIQQNKNDITNLRYSSEAYLREAAKK